MRRGSVKGQVHSVTQCQASVSMYRHTSWNPAVLVGIAVSSVEDGYIMAGRVARLSVLLTATSIAVTSLGDRI